MATSSLASSVRRARGRCRGEAPSPGSSASQYRVSRASLRAIENLARVSRRLCAPRAFFEVGADRGAGPQDLAGEMRGNLGVLEERQVESDDVTGEPEGPCLEWSRGVGTVMASSKQRPLPTCGSHSFEVRSSKFEVAVMKPPKVRLRLPECGSQSPKWLGRCPDCGAWNSFVEERWRRPAEARGAAPALGRRAAQLYARRRDRRRRSGSAPGISEFDRVLGGGIVPGSLVLLGGEPGIGKSTLLLQAAAHFAAHVGPVLYCSGEESEHQIKMRGERLGVPRAPLYLLAETCVERLIDEVDRLKPALLIVDSIQTVFSLKMPSAPGSVGQVRQAATDLLFTAKGRNLPTILVGHVTKDGSLAGPKVLEHVVDTVLYFEGEQHHAHRVVRAVKNRFGAVSELGVFEMTADRPCARCRIRRSCSSPSGRRTCRARRCCARSRDRGPFWSRCRRSSARRRLAMPRRTASGLDQNRLSLLLAVLDKRAGLNLSTDDVFVNVAGGMTIDEPAADLAVVVAVASSLRNRPSRPMSWCSAKSDWPARCARRPRRRCACARPRSSDSPAVSCRTANVSASDDAGGLEVVGGPDRGEALDALM